MLTGPRLPDLAEQVDQRRLRARHFSDDARALLEHVWALMDMPCGKYLVVMLGLWLPLLAAAGDLDRPFATEAALAELRAMSAATVDRYLKPARDRMRIKGISTALSRWWDGWKDSVGEQRVDGVVQGSSVPDGDHQPLRVAVFPVSAEFS